jgi:hypothetical protein
LESLGKKSKNLEKPLVFSNRNSYNAKTHVKNSFTETNIGKFSNKKIPKKFENLKLNDNQAKSNQNSIQIDFDQKFIFNTMNFQNKKNRESDVFKNKISRTKGRMSSSSVSRNKLKPFNSKLKWWTRNKKSVQNQSKTPKKNISIRKQIKNLDKMITSNKDLYMKKKKSNNYISKQFLKIKPKMSNSHVIFPKREISNDKKKLKSNFFRKLSKPTSLERPFKPRLPSYDKKNALFGLAKYKLENKEIKKMIINKNIFGKINHLRRNTSSGYNDIKSKRNFQKKKLDGKIIINKVRSKDKRISRSRNSSNTPGYTSFRGQEKTSKKSHRNIKNQKRYYIGESLEKYKQIRKRSPLAKKLLLNKSRDKYLSKEIFIKPN